MRHPSLLPLLLLAAPAASPPAQTPRLVEVELSSFDFTPEEIRLSAGRPYELVLVNGSNSASYQKIDLAEVGSLARLVGCSQTGVATHVQEISRSPGPSIATGSK